MTEDISQELQPFHIDDEVDISEHFFVPEDPVPGAPEVPCSTRGIVTKIFGKGLRAHAKCTDPQCMWEEDVFRDARAAKHGRNAESES